MKNAILPILKKPRLLLNLLVICFLQLQLSVAQDADIKVTLSLKNNEAKLGDPVVVVYKIINKTSKSVFVLEWGTPLLTTDNEFAILTKGNNKVKYIGTYYNRMDPDASSYIEILPNSEKQVEADITRLWAIKDTGEYKIKLKEALFDVVTDKRFVPTEPGKLKRFLIVENPELTFKISFNPDYVPVIERPLALKGANNTYNGFTAAQQQTIENALTAMNSFLPTLIGDLATSTWANYPLNSNFFGSSATQTPANILDSVNFYNDSINIVFTNSTTCATNTIASTTGLPNITICTAFWNLPTSWSCQGADSQPACLIHELAHWAGTADNAYGCTADVALVSSDLSQALNNADNYSEYADFTYVGGVPCYNESTCCQQKCGSGINVVISAGLFLVIGGVMYYRLKL